MSRYCIALSDARPIQTAEEDFFEFFHDKNIPLVFVFTKYDRLVRDIQDEISGGAEEVTMKARVEAEQQARNYVDEMRYKLECAIGRGVKVQEVSNKGWSR
jgi:GTP-binding protein EngB required for normal cell division